MFSHRFVESDIVIEKTETAFAGFFRVLRYRLRHRLFSGEWSRCIERELLVRGESVGVLLYDPQRDCVALAQQFRIGCLDNAAGAWVWEVVAGMMKPDESAEVVAIREVEEETGLSITASQLQKICSYYSSPGGTDEHLHLFCARVDLPDSVAGVFGLAEEAEDIRVKTFATADTFGAMLNGSINNAATIIALQWLQLNRESLRRQA
ncbi:MAG TPA: NUDIX domain-containing protein [Pseudomonadales bacterium]|nr:NUDIX domain-containing protein [Pseudomonadales bacterium]